MSTKIDERRPEAAPRRAGVGTVVRKVFGADWSSAAIALVGLIVVVGLLRPEFLSFTQLSNVAQQSVYVALMASGLAFLITQGEVDLSVGGTYVLSAVATAILIQNGLDPWLAAICGLLLAVAVGALNSVVVLGIRINSLIATLAMGWVLRGLSAAISGGRQIIGMPIDHPFFTILGGGEILNVAVSVWILVLVVAVLTVVLRATPFGFRVREIGSNEDAAQFAGIPVRRTKATAFLMSGFIAGIAGLLGLAFFTSGDPTSGNGFELFAVAGAVIGGNPLTGGRATVFGAAIGAVLLNAVSIALVYFNIPAVWSQFATGLIIISAVSVDGIRRHRRSPQDA
ncbi:ABC transporter permease [Actinotalea sp. M2MS4P-6]|uniref:ABC transporter permease n=1 Tax=Actinotalea sp. M2MS4P-6 TaxID=2983762 RepID=UPI0021E43391|nr:ABC transporter permease [Actinotalea sp. M2MS4P-6]MCV2393876.1 ABC transporter permease [Actinotalea sp. M2MS4P-6]